MKITHEGKILFNGGSDLNIPGVGETIWVNFKPYKVVDVRKNFNSFKHCSGVTIDIKVEAVSDE